MISCITYDYFFLGPYVLSSTPLTRYRRLFHPSTSSEGGIAIQTITHLHIRGF
jgi:hypothetical protein